jgi:succinate dehydrogenase / fumarate reductase cytochrome b subunit
MGQGLLQVVLAGWLLAFLYHFANGIRHLFWDAGYGFEKAQARRSAAIVVAFAVVAGGVLLYLFFCPEGVRS